jgi:hypothetical protein
METLVGCGVVGHDESCLCDVHIKEVTPIMSTNNMVRDMRYGLVIAEMFNFGIPWTTESMVDFFEKVCFAHDSLDNEYVPEPLRLEGVPANDGWKMVRDSVREGLAHKSEPSIVDVLYRLNVSFDTFIQSISNGKFHCNKPFSMDNLIQLEQILTDPDVVYTKAVKEFGLPLGTVQSLMEYWEPVRSRKPSRQLEARSIILKMSLQGLPPREIIPKVYEATGIRYSRSAVTHIKNRYRKRCQDMNPDDMIDDNENC